MSKSEHLKLTQIKPKLKYILSEYMNRNTWRRSILLEKGKRIPIIATLDLNDEDTKRYFLFRAKLTGSTGSLITIGYFRS
jgi:hypothetical protein